MKKNYFLHTAILLVALVCGSVPVWSQTYKKISSIEELTDGKYVIAYENMAMENKANGSRIAATAINVTDNAIISPDASIIWEITTTANGMSINNNGMKTWLWKIKLMVLELLLLQSMLQIMLLLVPMHLLFGRLQQQQTV